MVERPYQIYENEKGWNVLDCTSRLSNKLVFQYLSKGVAHHYAQVLNAAFGKGYEKGVAESLK